MPFLTEIDPNAKTKGSRDPLGTLGVWTGFGRRVVGNLTTQTTSLDDFRVLVIGCWIEDQLAGRVAIGGDAFLVWEELTAYARLEVLTGTPSFRGVTKAKKLRTAGKVRVSAERDSQLLTNQRAYGIWGLYRAAGWRCGLVNADAPLVRNETLQLVRDVYLPILERAWGPEARELLRWARTGHDLRLSQDRPKLEAIAECISGPLREAETELYRDTLVFGGIVEASVASRQRELALQLRDRVPAGQRPSRDDILAIAAATPLRDLAAALEDIVACEAVLAPAAMCFSFLSQQDRTPVSVIAARLETHFATAPALLDPRWLERLRLIAAERGHLISAVHDRGGSDDRRWLAIAEALHEKDFDRVLRLLIEQNTAVSRDRGASTGWVVVESNDLLKVHLADPSIKLREPDDVAELWWNPYFLDTLHGFVHALPEPAA